MAAHSSIRNPALPAPACTPLANQRPNNQRPYSTRINITAAPAIHTGNTHDRPPAAPDTTPSAAITELNNSSLSFGSNANKGNSNNIPKYKTVNHGRPCGSFLPAIQTQRAAINDTNKLVNKSDISLGIGHSSSVRNHSSRALRIFSIAFSSSCISFGSSNAATNFSGRPSKKVLSKWEIADRRARFSAIAGL